MNELFRQVFAVCLLNDRMSDDLLSASFCKLLINIEYKKVKRVK